MQFFSKLTIFCALLAFSLANAIPVSNPLSNAINDAKAQTILQKSDNSQLHSLPLDIEIPLNIRIQLVQTERQQPNGNKVPVAQLALASPKFTLMQTGPARSQNVEESAAQKDPIANSNNKDSDWLIDPVTILAVFCVAFVIYFFGSIWFFCTFLAPVRAAFPSGLQSKKESMQSLPPLHI